MDYRVCPQGGARAKYHMVIKIWKGRIVWRARMRSGNFIAIRLLDSDHVYDVLTSRWRRWSESQRVAKPDEIWNLSSMFCVFPWSLRWVGHVQKISKRKHPEGSWSDSSTTTTGSFGWEQRLCSDPPPEVWALPLKGWAQTHYGGNAFRLTVSTVSFTTTTQSSWP